MVIPLWQPDNATPDSSVFTIKPGEVAVFTATGFAKKRARTTAEEFDSPQLACLHKLIVLTNPDGEVIDEPSSVCDALSDSVVFTTTVIDEPVRVNCSTVSISKCSNTLLWALPGLYHWHLNDTTAIGAAQIWMEIFQSSELPLGMLADFTGVSHA